MTDVSEAQKVLQYQLKARVHDVQEGHYRGLVEVGVRTARGFDTKLHYCGLVRSTWADAIDDAEKAMATMRAQHCTDAECTVVSARGSTAFDTFMALLSSSHKANPANPAKLVGNIAGKRHVRRAAAPKLMPVAETRGNRALESESAGVVELRRRHA